MPLLWRDRASESLSHLIERRVIDFAAGITLAQYLHSREMSMIP